MIIDIIIVNTIFWSIFLSFRQSFRLSLYKFFVLILAIAITISCHERIYLFDSDVVAYNILEKDYIIPVVEDHKRDYLLTKAFVEELPVTTEIQNKVIENYYLDNTEYIAYELIDVSGVVVTKTIEMLLIFVIILIPLNVLGLFINKKSISSNFNGRISSFACIINTLGNLIVVSVFMVLVKLIVNFLLFSLPEISFQRSFFKPLIYETVDLIIRLM